MFVMGRQAAGKLKHLRSSMTDEAELRAKFAQFDTDRDGRLSSAELATLCADLGSMLSHAELEGDLARKNELLRDAKYDRVRAQKAYNDALRTYSQKLVDLGIPSQEIDAMGFTLLPSQSTSGPAGLVVQ